MPSAYAKRYVQENIKQSKNGTGKGYALPMPGLVAYPNSAVPFKIGGKVVPVSNSCASLYLAELMYEFNLEVAKREKARDTAQ
jgi:hypothetical protein